jgi:hypothetical protein
MGPQLPQKSRFADRVSPCEVYMSRKKTFDNGSYVEWVDRETLKYTSGDFSVLVWVDFEPGLFSGGRIIKASSIKNWDAKPAERGNFQIFWGFKKELKIHRESSWLRA